MVRDRCQPPSLLRPPALEPPATLCHFVKDPARRLAENVAKMDERAGRKIIPRLATAGDHFCRERGRLLGGASRGAVPSMGGGEA